MSKINQKNPAFQFVASDWLNDHSLRMCAPETRGLWIDVLCLMCLSDERGYLMVKSEILDEENLRKILNFPKKKFEICMQELTRFGIIKKDERGRFYSKRMVDAQSLSQKRSVSGKLGGNPNLVVLDKQMVKQVVKQKDFGEKKPYIYIDNNINNINSLDNIGNNNQIHLLKVKERKNEKKEKELAIQITHPLQVYIRDNFPQVSKLKNQMSADDCETLLTKHTNLKIVDTLLAMENFKQLTSKYVSVYLTLNNWLNRQPNDTNNNNKNNRGTNYEDALRNF